MGWAGGLSLVPWHPGSAAWSLKFNDASCRLCQPAGTNELEMPKGWGTWISGTCGGKAVRTMKRNARERGHQACRSSSMLWRAPPPHHPPPFPYFITHCWATGPCQMFYFQLFKFWPAFSLATVHEEQKWGTGWWEGDEISINTSTDAGIDKKVRGREGVVYCVALWKRKERFNPF